MCVSDHYVWSLENSFSRRVLYEQVNKLAIRKRQSSCVNARGMPPALPATCHHSAVVLWAGYPSPGWECPSPVLGRGVPLSWDRVPLPTWDWFSPRRGRVQWCTPTWDCCIPWLGLGYLLPVTGVPLPGRNPGPVTGVRPERRWDEQKYYGMEMGYILTHMVQTDIHLWEQYFPHPSDAGRVKRNRSNGNAPMLWILDEKGTFDPDSSYTNDYRFHSNIWD